VLDERWRSFRAMGLQAGKLHGDVLTVSGETVATNVSHSAPTDLAVIRVYSDPLAKRGGLMVITGNLFDSAIMKTSVITEEFRGRYLSNPNDPDAFEGRAIVFDGPEDYHVLASTTPSSRSTRTAYSLSAMWARSPSRAQPRWSTCNHQPNSSSAASTRCRQLAMVARAAPPMRHPF